VAVSQENIGRLRGKCCSNVSHLARFEAGTENPRVGGSIPPLATIQINILNQDVASARIDSLSNIRAGVQYFGPLLT